MTASSSKKTCFIVGPIGPAGSEVRNHADWFYDGIIKPVFAQFSDFCDPIRADKISQPGMITTQIIELLLDADLVIADLSGSNPNAFYEIGIRHVVQKPIIHMQLKDEKEPFDVSGYRAVKFSLKHPSDLVAAQNELVGAIKVATSGEHRVENPVTHARGRIKIEETATPEQRIVLDELRSLSDRLARIERQPTKAAVPIGQLCLFISQSSSADSVSPRLKRVIDAYGFDGWKERVDEDGDIRLDLPIKRLEANKHASLIKDLEGIRGVRSVVDLDDEF